MFVYAAYQVTKAFGGRTRYFPFQKDALSLPDIVDVKVKLKKGIHPALDLELLASEQNRIDELLRDKALKRRGFFSQVMADLRWARSRRPPSD